MSLRYRRIALSICTSSSKTDPTRCLLSPSKSQKSQGARSGLYGCSNSSRPIEAIVSFTFLDLCCLPLFSKSLIPLSPVAGRPLK